MIPLNISLLIFILLSSAGGSSSLPSDFYSQLPELKNNSTIIVLEPQVCSLTDTIMTYSDPNKMIKDYFCFSVWLG